MKPVVKFINTNYQESIKTW